MSENILKAFLTGIDPSTPHNTLSTFLSSKIEGVTAVKTDLRKRQGYVFVHFEEEQKLKNFLKIKTLMFGKRKLTIKPYLKGDALRKFKQDLLDRRLFVKHLPSNWRDSDLENFFKKFGEIDSAYIVYDKITNNSRQFGYVMTETQELAEKIHKMKEIEVEGQTLFVRKHMSNGATNDQYFSNCKSKKSKKKTAKFQNRSTNNSNLKGKSRNYSNNQ